MGFSLRVAGALKLASGAAIGSVLQGFSMGIIAGTLSPIVAEFGLEQRSGLQGLIAASATYGAIAGSLGSGRLGDAAGRRGTLMVSSALFLIGGVGMAVCTNVHTLVVGRLIAGIAAGLVSSSVNTYIAESSQPEVRGALSMLPQLGISSGILLSYVVALGALLRGVGWRPMLGFSVGLATLQVIALAALPESPRWLLSQRADVAAARAALTRLCGSADAEAVEAELMQLSEGLRQEGRSAAAAAATATAAMATKQPTSASGWAALSEPGVRHTLGVCCTLQAFQQLCGVNAIVFFTPQILAACGVVRLFERWGVSAPVAPLLATILAYLPKIPTALLAVRLIESLGRRQLLVTFTPLLALCVGALALSVGGSSVGSAAAATAAVTLFGVVFGLSLGPLPNIISAELYPTRARSAGVAAATGVQFLSNAFVVAAFPVLRTSLGERTVLGAFAVLSALAWLFVLRCVPETKGRRLEDMSHSIQEPPTRRKAA